MRRATLRRIDRTRAQRWLLAASLALVAAARGLAQGPRVPPSEPAIPQPIASTRFFQQGPKLVGTGAEGTPVEQGLSLALSANGDTAIVGAPGDDGFSGAAWVWTRHTGIWTQQGSKLVGSGADPSAYQGYAVAISADGNTAIVGGPYGPDYDVGAAWIWTRSGGAWTQQGPKIVGSGGKWAAQGYSVAISADGNTVIVGGPYDNTFPLTGAVWVWIRTDGVWTQQGSKLVGSGAVDSWQGSSVSLSADGNTAIVGGREDDAGAGAAWVWTRNGGVWTQQGVKLVGSGAIGAAHQGVSVSLSADGNTAMIGGDTDINNLGAAWVWTRSGGVWTQQGLKLIGSGAVGTAHQGSSVSLSADGNTAIVGGYGDNGNAGAAWIWTRDGSVWTQRGPKLHGSGGSGSEFQGLAASLAGDGDTALVGGPGDNAVGAAWAFLAHAPADFDGDGKSDRTIFRPSNGVWYSATSTGGGTSTSWGVSTDIDVAGDYDGDGNTDVAVWRPSTGTWYIVQSSNAVVRVTTWGINGDTPLAGDVDGDGQDDTVIYRPSAGTWYVLKSGGGTSAVGWGISTDQPLLGDFDGDSHADLVAYRPSSGTWYILKSGGGSSFVSWGANGDIPVAGDWDGDGTNDPAVFRPSTGQWFVNESTGGVLVVGWGISTDLPVAGDWDGDGKSDCTVWRDSAGVWYTRIASGGTAAVGWGVSGDKPIGRLFGS